MGMGPEICLNTPAHVFFHTRSTHLSRVPHTSHRDVPVTPRGSSDDVISA